MLPLFAGATTIKCVNCDKLPMLVSGCHQDDGPAIIASRMVWCNSLYYGITYELMRRLQSVQNVAARRQTV